MTGAQGAQGPQGIDSVASPAHVEFAGTVAIPITVGDLSLLSALLPFDHNATAVALAVQSFDTPVLMPGTVLVGTYSTHFATARSITAMNLFVSVLAASALSPISVTATIFLINSIPTLPAIVPSAQTTNVSVSVTTSGTITLFDGAFSGTTSLAPGTLVIGPNQLIGVFVSVTATSGALTLGGGSMSAVVALDIVPA